MKKLVLSGALVFLASFLFAQRIENFKLTGADYPEFISKTQYTFPVYTKAQIAFKSGNVGSVRINYNNYLQAMKYISGLDTLEIANPEDISYIAVGQDTLFYDHAYLHWIASSASVRIAAKVTYKENERALVGAFGSSSPAQNIMAHTKILHDGILNSELALNETVTITKETTYYINAKGDKKQQFLQATANNIGRLFPKKKVDDFIKENKLNLNREEDLVDLVIYISKN
ncbi:MAG TPA: hypothetical protein VM871_06180 [Flavisolibacter sp.]|jgi:glycosyltransferase involved in cell wall biosynthesis|nr:hypothetical protein [Flavisolibacter sp.]